MAENARGGKVKIYRSSSVAQAFPLLILQFRRRAGVDWLENQGGEPVAGFSNDYSISNMVHIRHCSTAFLLASKPAKRFLLKK